MKIVNPPSEEYLCMGLLFENANKGNKDRTLGECKV